MNNIFSPIAKTTDIKSTSNSNLPPVFDMPKNTLVKPTNKNKNLVNERNIYYNQSENKYKGILEEYANYQPIGNLEPIDNEEVAN